MLLPLMILGFGTLVMLENVLDHLIEVTEETTREIGPIGDARSLIPQAAIYVDYYAVTGDPAARKLFRRYNRRADGALDELIRAPFGSKEERALVKRSHLEWGRIRELADDILVVSNPVGDPAVAKKSERMMVGIERAENDLERALDMAFEEIEETLETAKTNRGRNMWLIITAFAASVWVALTAGLWLAHSILRPLGELEDGVNRLAVGDLTLRVKPTTQDELSRLGTAFNTMAAKIQDNQEKLTVMATKDSLTGLDNRREFYRRLEEEVQRSRRYSNPFSLLMIDIDRFKGINDIHGHLAGDQVLRAIASLIKDTLRPMDKAARWGGEEFMTLLPQTEADGAVAAAERICRVIADRMIYLEADKKIHVTVSIGVVAFPDDADTDEELVSRADLAMYAAKRAGRNRVCPFSSLHGAGEEDLG